MAGASWWGVPPRTEHVLLPARRTAALAGLALYTATEPHQVLALAASRALVRARLGGLLRAVPEAELPDPQQWAQWCRRVAEPRTGPVAATAWLTPAGERSCALLLDPADRPVGFVKLRPPAEQDDVEPRATRLLLGRPLRRFCTPDHLADDVFAGRATRLLSPLPAGPHRRARPGPGELAAVVDEVQERLADLPRPTGTPAGWRPSHGDLTARNARRAPDGRLWLFDWEYARWAPRLADELRWWTAEAAGRRRPRAEPLLARLRARGDDAEIADALDHPGFLRPRERALHEALRGLLAR